MVASEEELTTAVVSSATFTSVARQQWEEGGRAYRDGKLVVVMPSECNLNRAKHLVANINFILSAFEHDHGAMADGYTVFITDKKTFWMDHVFEWVPIVPPPNYIGPPRHGRLRIIGVCCRSTREIAVVAGSLDCLPALYHEFCHAAIDGDPDHVADHWKQFDARGDELSAKIRARWH